MRQFFTGTCILLVGMSLYASSLFADLKNESETTMKLKGVPFMGMLGANKPSRQIMYLKGNKQKTDTMLEGKLQTSHIVDLDRKVMINLDHRMKTYSEMTFEQFRAMMQKNVSGAMSDIQQEQPDLVLSAEVDVKKPGDKKNIAGLATEKVILEMTMKGSGTVEKKDGGNENVTGGVKVISTQWMAKSGAGQKEMRDFTKKLAEVMGFMPGKAGMSSMFEQALGSNQQIGSAMNKLQKESAKLAGAPMYTHTTVEIVETEEKAKRKMHQMPKNLSGLMKKLGKKYKYGAEATSGLTVETTTKVLSWDTSALPDAIFEIPADYKKEQQAVRKY